MHWMQELMMLLLMLLLTASRWCKIRDATTVEAGQRKNDRLKHRFLRQVGNESVAAAMFVHSDMY